jgi:hypothetical protein
MRHKPAPQDAPSKTILLLVLAHFFSKISQKDKNYILDFEVDQ